MDQRVGIGPAAAMAVGRFIYAMTLVAENGCCWARRTYGIKNFLATMHPLQNLCSRCRFQFWASMRDGR